MLVTMITTMAGPNVSAQSGQKIELPDDMAVDLIRGGYAIPEKVDIIETTSISPQESAVIKKQPRKRGR